MSWNEYLLSDFPAEAFKPISIVFDPQSIIADEMIFSELETRGYKIHEYTDTLALRYTYEMSIRNNPTAKWIILVRDEQIALTDLPFDIVLQSKVLSFSLESIFPTLNFAVINDLDRKYIPLLFEVRDDFPYETLGLGLTCEFILKRLFSLSLDIVNSSQDLVQMLFAIHVKYSIRSNILLKYLTDKLAVKHQFELFNIQILFSSERNFAFFIQEQLSNYFDCRSSSVELDFNSSEIRSGITHLFSSGLIQVGSNIEHMQKMAQYLGGNGAKTLSEAMDALIDDLESRIPSEQEQFQSWLSFARDWAELTALCVTTELKPRGFEVTQRKINETFHTWQKERYHLLASLPPQKPIMVHQIIRSIGREITNDRKKRFALIVVDGLAFNQWAGIRPILEEHFSVTTNGCFAWVPSLTAISRQAIFSGKIPAMFADSISTTAKEENLWIQAWENYGFTKNEVLYRKRLGDGSCDEVLGLISPRTKICGFVIDKIDSIMHGMQLGNTGMHNQLKLWISQGYLKNLLSALLQMDFDVLLTSDHGNIECKGRGKLQDGVLAEQHGERVRIYSQQELAIDALRKVPQSFELGNSGLPSNLFPISLPYDWAFANTGVNLVAHGGNSIEEIIVPVVHISNKRGK